MEELNIRDKEDVDERVVEKTITYGDEPSDNGVEHNGFVNSETESVLEGTLSYDYNYPQGGNAGSYTIMPKGLTSDNYEISFEAGTLTVEKADPVVTAPTAMEDLTYNGQAQELVNAGAATGGTMHYVVTTENTAPTDNLYTTSIPTGTNAGKHLQALSRPRGGEHGLGRRDVRPLRGEAGRTARAGA